MTPKAVASSSRRGRRRDSRGSRTTVSPASSSAPRAPSGQPTEAPGSRAPVRATCTSQAAGSHPTQARACAAGRQTGATSAARTPITVAGATAGTASRFAGTESRPSCAEIATTTGPQATWAAAGTASASASQDGMWRARCSRQGGARTSSPPVASTDRAKPGVAARSGSSSTSTSTAVDKAGIAARRLPVDKAISPTSPMTAARSTLGDGRARTTKPASATAASTGAPRTPIPDRRASSSTAPQTIATLVPLTAVRWVRPTVWKSASSAGSSRLVSPTTSPGSSPASASGSGSTARRSPARRCPAARWTALGPDSTCGEPRPDSTAATSSPRSGARSRPSSRTR